MNNLNSVLIEGNLTKDPELSYTPNGKAVSTLRIATNRYFKQDDEYQEEASFFDVTVWAKQAEACAEYLKKGRGVRVVGRLKQDRWQDPEGNNRSQANPQNHTCLERADLYRMIDQQDPIASHQQRLS